ncbi:MAG: M23/M56 family metallopeptidase, partial [Fulvivirga sp.]
SAFFMVKQSEKLLIHGQEVYANAKIKEPISLLNRIYIPSSWKENVPYEIIIHEKEHINKKHFIDLVLIELSIIIFWFNPVIYQLKKAIRINLEYLADRQVILQGGDLLAYQSLLVSQSLESSNRYPITTNFAAPLKNRISMMNKTKTRNWARLVIVGALPLAAALLAMNTRPEVKAPILEFAEPLTNLIVEENRPSGWPVQIPSVIKITSTFGERMHPLLKEKRHHDGVDLQAKEGTPVYATADGVIEIAKFDYFRGYYVQIKHGDKYATQYAHMQNFVVMQNQRVFKDQLIGYVGNTGQSIGSHLHYEIHEDGKPVDPKLTLEGC